jgi:hypothetical protein
VPLAGKEKAPAGEAGANFPFVTGGRLKRYTVNRLIVLALHR